MKTLYFADQALHILDQTKLPSEETYIVTSEYRDVCRAIKILAVRGAPAIGVAAAYAVYLASVEYAGQTEYRKKIKEAAEEIRATRPTAVNLSWAVDKALSLLDGLNDEEIPQELLALADDILEEDMAMNQRIGEYGCTLFNKPQKMLTHCNAGALATAGYGTALGVVRSAHKKGLLSMVYADETRPLLQGSRLTVYELMSDDIPVTLITDNMAAYHMAKGLVDCIVVGADRIVANGDTANKIGTYNLAILAKYHRIPFYVAAPYSTFDLSLSEGTQIEIEQRDPDEVRMVQGMLVSPEHATVSNPAFDVTPAGLITAIITDRGIIQPVNEEMIRKLVHES